MVREIWKDIKDYEGSYQISNLGRVRIGKDIGGPRLLKIKTIGRNATKWVELSCAGIIVNFSIEKNLSKYFS